jgi:raffinose/stachyose/melibiose transport system substrate-binding protein
MKKSVSFACVVAMLASTMPATVFAEANEEVSGSITVWEHSYSFEDSMNDVIAAFQEQYPNVEVNAEIKSENYYSLLSTAIQSGDGPDVFWTNGTATTNMADLVANDAVEDLTDVVDYSFITDSAMDLANIDGKSYSVPWLTMDTRTCYYNKDLFEENGWSVPTTFSEFETLLATVKEAGIIPISLANDSWALLFAYEPILAAYDKDYTLGLADYSSKADGQAARDCLQLMVDWGNEGYYGDNWLGVNGDAMTLAFTTGQAAMMLDGSWSASTISMNNPDLNYGAFTVPSEDGSTELVGTAANGFSVNAASDNLEAANAFVNFCATQEAQTIWVQSQGAVSATPDIEPSTDIAREISAGGQGAPYRSWQNVLASYSTTENATNVWENDFTKVFSGDMTVDEFMDELAAEME